jgi:hypothetical protein
MEREEFLVCEFCGDRIGVYEPIVAIEDNDMRETAIAREPELWQKRPPVMHAHCARMSRSG